MSLTSLASIKSALKITDDSEDQYLTLIQQGVERAFVTLTGYQFAQQSYLEYYDSQIVYSQTPSVRLRQTPVYSITNVWVDWLGLWGQAPNAFSGDPLTQGVDFYLELDGPNNAYSESGRLRWANWGGGTWWWGGGPSGCGFTPPGHLARHWIPGQGDIKVQYTGGWASIPMDIQLAIWEGVAMMRARQAFGYAGLLTSESFDGYSYSLSPLEMLMFSSLGSVQAVVATYTKLVI